MFRLLTSSTSTHRALGVAAGAAGGLCWHASPATLCNSSNSSSSSRSSPLDLSNKVVLITGASAGIGLACAHQFAAKGCKLVLVGRRTALLEKVKSDILQEHPNCRILCETLDVADTKACMALPSRLALSEFAAVSVLVNNAGLALGVNSAETTAPEDMEKVINTNVLGLMAMSRAFLPGMKERGEGHLINLGSVAGLHAYATGSLYCASKYAVAGFTAATRHDLVGTPIRVTHIAPGMVAGTEFSVVRLGDASKAAAVYADIEALSPDDVADNVVYAATRPRHVQIADIIMYATNQSGPRDVVRVGPGMGAPSK